MVSRPVFFALTDNNNGLAGRSIDGIAGGRSGFESKPAAPATAIHENLGQFGSTSIPYQGTKFRLHRTPGAV
jgi:hypothetical protein